MPDKLRNYFGKKNSWGSISPDIRSTGSGKNWKKREINIKKIKEEIGNGMPVTIAGIIETVRQVITKNNERMAFLKISDLTDSIEAVAFPSVFTKSIETFVPEKCIALTGKGLAPQRRKKHHH